MAVPDGVGPALDQAKSWSGMPTARTTLDFIWVDEDRPKRDADGMGPHLYQWKKNSDSMGTYDGFRR